MAEGLIIKPKILVLCTGNSCRSQMAEGYLRYFAQGRAEVFSAGVEAHGLNPRAVQAMGMDGIDISGHASKTVDQLPKVEFDHILTVCDNALERCPYLPGPGNRIHHSFSDPAKATGTESQIMGEFIKVRNEIKSWCQSFIDRHLAA